MKKHIITVGLMLFVAMANAQTEHRQPPSTEDKLKHTAEFFQKEVGINESKQKAVAEVFRTFFAGEDKVRKENPPPPPPAPPVKVKTSMDKLMQERDAKLKQILSVEEFTKFKAKEKQMHPPPPGGKKGDGGQMPPPQQN